MIKAVLPAMAKPLIEARLPGEIEARWFTSGAEAIEAATDAEIAWIDMYDKGAIRSAVDGADQLKWLFTIYAGLDHLPMERLSSMDVTVTNGTGINTIPVAEYCLLGMLALAKAIAPLLLTY